MPPSPAAATDEGEARTAELVVADRVLPITERARERFDPKQANELYVLAQARLPLGFPSHVYVGWLEIAARYDLDPFLNEIWLAEFQGRPTSWIGRDGYLRVARRDTAFIDVDADVVCENDDFRVTRSGDGRRLIEHSYGNPATRGEVVGAWAELLRDGKPGRYFFAPRHEYERDPDKSAWRYLHAMIIKAPISFTCRTTYGVNGAVPADELQAGLRIPLEAGVEAAIAKTQANVDAVLPPRLRGLVIRAAQVDPLVWRANDVAARLPDPSDPAFQREAGALGDEIEKWLADHEVEVHEAEVVDGPPDETPPQRDAGETLAAAAGPPLDPFSAMIADHDAQAACADPTEQRAALDARWSSTAPEDVAWREQVAPLLSRRADLDASAEDVTDDQRAMVDEELRQLDEALDALDVPTGWIPSNADGEASEDGDVRS